jgi:hypothetical protein
MRVHAGATALLSLLMVVLGVALLVRTLAAGGGDVGILLGALFVVAGLGRLYLGRRR